MNGDQVDRIRIPRRCQTHQSLIRLNNTVNIRSYPVQKRKELLKQLIPSLSSISLKQVPDADLLFVCCLGYLNYVFISCRWIRGILLVVLPTECQFWMKVFIQGFFHHSAVHGTAEEKITSSSRRIQRTAIMILSLLSVPFYHTINHRQHWICAFPSFVILTCLSIFLFLMYMQNHCYDL